MKLFSRFPLVAAAGVLVVWAGCRAPLALNRSLVSRRNAFQNKNLLGCGSWNFMGSTSQCSPWCLSIPWNKRDF